MARINIEDTLWSDRRFLRLCVLLGDEMRAIGAVVLAWKTAQRYWCPDRQPIPEDAFIDAGLPEELVTCGLAKREDGVRMSGSEEHFAWWFQRQEAGRRGGQATAKRKSADAEREGSKLKQNVASYSSSSSISLRKQEENKSISAEPVQSTELERRRKDPFPNSFETVQELLGSLEPGTLARWSMLYKDREFLERESLKAFGYYVQDNPSKCPKSRRGWAQALSSWFERGWTRAARNTPGKSAAVASADSWFAKMEAEESAKTGRSA